MSDIPAGQSAAVPPGSAVTCSYVGPSGAQCPSPTQGTAGLCYWHDPVPDKRGPDVKAELEALAASGRSLEGFKLRGAALRSAHLTHRQKGKTVDLRGADLSRADLAGAHMFHTDLRGASLLKADLSGANLNLARLEDANLLGADLAGARIERVEWGHHLMQETRARAAERAGDRMEAEQLYGEAEETYRAISLAVEERGHNNLAGHFFVKQMRSRRLQMPLWSRRRFGSWVVDVVCGYGESAWRVIALSLSIILGWAVGYFFVGLQSPEGPIGFLPEATALENLFQYFTCVYFSVVTFTTVGYGDILPMGYARLLAGSETFLGWFAISLFVVLFVKRMTR